MTKNPEFTPEAEEDIRMPISATYESQNPAQTQDRSDQQQQVEHIDNQVLSARSKQSECRIDLCQITNASREFDLTKIQLESGPIQQQRIDQQNLATQRLTVPASDQAGRAEMISQNKVQDARVEQLVSPGSGYQDLSKGIISDAIKAARELIQRSENLRQEIMKSANKRASAASITPFSARVAQRLEEKSLDEQVYSLTPDKSDSLLQEFNMYRDLLQSATDNYSDDVFTNLSSEANSKNNSLLLKSLKIITSCSSEEDKQIGENSAERN